MVTRCGVPKLSAKSDILGVLHGLGRSSSRVVQFKYQKLILCCDRRPDAPADSLAPSKMSPRGLTVYGGAKPSSH